MLERQVSSSGAMLFNTCFWILQLYIWFFSTLVAVIVLVSKIPRHFRLMRRWIRGSPDSLSPTVLALPFELRCNIYRYILPTQSCLRVMFNDKSMKFRFSPMYDRCLAAQCLACDHVRSNFCQAVDGVLLTVSSATRKECIKFIFHENAVLLINRRDEPQTHRIEDQRRELQDTKSILASYALQLRFVIIWADITWAPTSQRFKRLHSELMLLMDEAINVNRFYLYLHVKADLAGLVERRALDYIWSFARLRLTKIDVMVNLASIGDHETRQTQFLRCRALELKCERDWARCKRPVPSIEELEKKMHYWLCYRVPDAATIAKMLEESCSKLEARFLVD